ncbi:division/cell wall cluster transcriptional repressor MraZ [Polyangium sp. 15x6]|uniref:division/cell wall cluster transcriptional repressor MraZ n=1 Tax=Polyangium sp. 15x6 TaxID=3042687 RepID=UPI002499D849|nr:division/cell wall cluster transcriptional repressor MraZ [Polyangium sp. 15x6]MDI3287874.1 division/cell wall cluster transcriptional repressor MraZ [Polyangium sp. 15x6]
MFRGHFEHAIDAKGRTSLPARFRDVLDAAWGSGSPDGALRPKPQAPEGQIALILTPALFDPCLHCYPLRAWEELEAKIAALPQFEPNVVAFRRKYLSAAVECELDKQGRILVPPSLREHADLHKDVLWAGMGATAELWSKERWKAAQTMSEAELASFKAAIAEQFRL